MLAEGSVQIREWRLKTGARQLRGKLRVDQGDGRLEMTYSVPKAPEWWPNRLAAFEIAHQGRVTGSAVWPPPWPYVRMPIPALGQLLVVRLERKRIYRCGQSELYAEIVLPETITPDTPIIADAVMHGMKAGQGAEVRALYAAVELLYLDPKISIKPVGHPPDKPNTLTGDPVQDRALAHDWSQVQITGRLSWKEIAKRAGFDPRTVRRWVLWHRSHELGT